MNTNIINLQKYMYMNIIIFFSEKLWKKVLGQSTIRYAAFGSIFQICSMNISYRGKVLKFFF